MIKMNEELGPANGINEVWIICLDYGCEGLKEPFKAYTSLSKAQKAMRVMSDLGINSISSIKLVKAEIIE